jgi:predicted GNAT family acetyltransferase
LQRILFGIIKSNRKTTEMAGRGKIAETPKANTKGFKQCPDNINKKGTPRKLVSTVIADMKEKGIEPATAGEIKQLYLCLLNNTKEEIKTIADDETQPQINRIVAKAMMSDKGFEVIAELLNRAIGKSQQQIDHTSGGEKIQPQIIQLNPLPDD